MKKLSIVSLLSIVTLCTPFVCLAQTKKSASVYDTAPYPLEGEQDDTDVFAVPLDEDEESEYEEMKKLEKMGKEAEAKKK